MSIEHQSVLNKVQALREWGISHGLPLEKMFNGLMDAERFWFVYGVNPTNPSDKVCEYFEHDDIAANAYADEIKARGWEIYIWGGPAVGLPELQLSPLFLDSSEEYRTHLILHEAVHMWVQKYFSLGVEVPGSLDEGLAEYISFSLMHEWFREVNPLKVFMAAQYIGARILVLSETLNLAREIRLGNQESRTRAIDELLLSLKKWKRDHNTVSSAGTKIAKASDFNLASFEYYGQYSAKFFEVREYFQMHKVNIYDFLSNPYQHREALLELAK